MVTAINTQALANSVSGSKSSAKTEKPDSEQIFKELDTGNKGYLTVDDLKAAVVKISAEGAKRADAAGKAAPSAEEMLAKMDSDGDGKVTQQEFKAAEPKGPPAGASGAQSAKPASGQAPAAGAGKSSSSDSTSSTAKTYEAADTNEDGKVSAKEQAAYDAKLAAEKAATQATSSGRTAEAEAAVKTYESVDQLSKAASAS
jgi:hypothetical protein